MTVEPFITVAVLALAISVPLVTLTMSKAAEPFRVFVARRSEWGHRLLNCQYCCAHHFALVAVLIWQPRLVEAWLPADLAVSWMVLTGLAYLAARGLRAVAYPPIKVDK